jgi:hypothetical protein
MWPTRKEHEKKFLLCARHTQRQRKSERDTASEDKPQSHENETDTEL